MPTKNEKSPHSRIYRQPVLVVYKLGDYYYGQLVHPVKKVPENAQKRATQGIYTVIGMWQDIGYTFGVTRDSLPDYVKLPAGAEFLFCKSVTNVPITV